MAQIANYINSYSDNTAYSADQSKDYPNISYIQANDNVKWNKYDPDHIVCIYNVTSTSEATKLLGDTRNITKMWIDGVEQQSIQANYTFSTTGKHTVKYYLSITSLYHFRQCNSLISITLPNNINSVSGFYNCSNLTSVIVPNATKFESQCFYYCTKLKSINSKTDGVCILPSETTTIGDSAFSGCKSLTSVTITDSVRSIGSDAFQNCTGLTNITVDSGNTKYDSRNNCNAIIETATNTLILGCQNTIIPNSVTSIGAHAFTNGDTSVTIPNSVTSIGAYAFEMYYANNNLINITIGNGVNSIGNYAFGSSSGSVTRQITFTLYVTTPPTLGNSVFGGLSYYTIYVPAESVEAYKTATNWSIYASRIQAIPTT